MVQAPRCSACVLFLTVFLLIQFSGGAVGQFPLVCVNNATLSGICCPSWYADRDQVCGGIARGRCVKLLSSDDVSKVPKQYLHDDRLYWPTRFFKYACECYGNYAGYMCHECMDGFRGENCTEKIIRLRRNLNSLNITEKQYIIEVMDHARYVQSDFVIMNMTHSSDPALDPHFLNATVFDYLAYLHYYASRFTNLNDAGTCQNATFRMDCAHRGSNFPIWHRYFMILWEREMRKISGNAEFSFPYWNWIDGGTICEHCTHDFLGATNTSDPDNRIETTNILYSWYVLCYIVNDCETCDPSIKFALIRNPGNNTDEASRLPTAAEVAGFMKLDSYDYPNFSTRTSPNSFRARMEGYATERGPTAELKMHNLVHAFMNGSFSGALTSSFDPVFYFHHSFMDKLLETWLRRTGARPSQLPSVGANPGHNRDSYLVPFFPVAKASWYFTSCRYLGYDYDDMTDTYFSDTEPEEMDTYQNVVEIITETNVSSLNVTTPKYASVMTAPPSNLETDEQKINPLIRYLIIEGGIIAILLVALITECSLRFRYFAAHHNGYRKLDAKNKDGQIYSELKSELDSLDDENDGE